MPLKIGSHSFRVKTATLSGIVFDSSWKKYDITINDGVNYSLLVECEPKAIGGESWSPLFEFDRFALKASSWQDIAGRSIEDVEGSAFTTFHGEVVATELRFGSRRGRRFSTTLEGECGEWPVTFSGPVLFEGYRVNGTFRDTEDSLARLLETHVRLDGLEASDSVVLDYIQRKKMRTKDFAPKTRTSKR